MKFHNSRSIRIDTRKGVKILDVHKITREIIGFFKENCFPSMSIKDIAKGLIIDGAIATVKERYKSHHLPIDILEEFYYLIGIKDIEEKLKMDISELKYEDVNFDKVITMYIVEYIMEYCHQYTARKRVIRRLVRKGAEANEDMLLHKSGINRRKIQEFYHLLGGPHPDELQPTIEI